MKKPSLHFTPFGRATPDYDSFSDILLGANLGCAQLVGIIERYVRWEKDGSSRSERAVPGSARFTVDGYVPALEALAGQEFTDLKACRDAVRKALL